MTEFGITELRGVVEACVGRHDATRLDDAALDTEFADIGLDSLVVFELATRLQDDQHVRISDDDLAQVRTPRNLIDLVNGKHAEPAR
jgi:act minimal PKS acyl carrier protein